MGPEVMLWEAAREAEVAAREAWERAIAAPGAR
jgi:hypothetical protein